jgi:O-antigen/teichoic acid export membrane protein
MDKKRIPSFRISLIENYISIIKPKLVILSNAGSIFGSRLSTSIMGFVYWWLAAQLFPPETVGLASAILSAMLLMGTIGVFGLDVFLVGEIPKKKRKSGNLITTAVLISSLISTCLGILFVLLAPMISSEFAVMSRNIMWIILFAGGTAFTSVTIIADQAMIGLLKGSIQLFRNILASVIKLGLLIIFVFFITNRDETIIFLSWIIGVVSSLAIVCIILSLRRTKVIYSLYPNFVAELGKSAFGHYLLNLALQVTGLILPTLVAVILSTREAAYFYTAWMIAGVAFIIPTALSTVLFAVGSNDQKSLPKNILLTIKVSLMFGVPISLVIFVGAKVILGFFGTAYATDAIGTLRILSLGILPLTVKFHYVAISRVRRRLYKAALFMSAGALSELILSAVGALIGNLSGLSAGWFTALCIESVLMLPLIYRTIHGYPIRHKIEYETTL